VPACVISASILAPAILAQTASRTLSLTREVRVASTEMLELTSVAAGELFSGTLEGHSISGTLHVVDRSGRRLRAFDIEDGIARVGFVSPGPGPYWLKIAATPVGSGGSYALEVSPRSISVRTESRHVFPRVDYQSHRIRQLESDVVHGVRDAESRFWSELSLRGAPIVERIEGNDDDLLVTFVWKEIYETHNVLLQWPPALSRADDYYLTRIPNTRVWYKTLRIRRGSRFSYTFSPNDTSDDRDVNLEPDPFNRRRAYDEDDSPHSLLELPGAPDESWAVLSPQIRGVLEKSTFESKLIKSTRDIWVYTPPAGSRTEARPLAIFFNGGMYAQSVGPAVLDNLVGKGKIRPTIVCFVNHGAAAATVDFARAVATELVAQLRAKHHLSKDAADTVIGGFSAGAVAAAYVALRHSDVFGKVFAQSGAFRGSLPDGRRLVDLYIEAPRLPLRFYIETGLYEPFPAAVRPLHEMALEESNIMGNRHFRDVLRAKGYDVMYRETGGGHQALHWRATLAEALMALLPPS